MLSTQRTPGYAEAAELCLVVGVGIEPTFRAFQTRTNPSQLSDLKLERKERFELSSRVWKTRMFPATSLPQVELPAGLEPA